MDIEKLDASQLHMLSVDTIKIKNPEHSLEERLEYIKQSIDIKWELICEQYKNGR